MDRYRSVFVSSILELALSIFVHYIVFVSIFLSLLVA